MPITEGRSLTTRKMCVGPPKQSFTEKSKKKKKYVEVLKFNPYHDKLGKFTHSAGSGGVLLAPDGKGGGGGGGRDPQLTKSIESELEWQKENFRETNSDHPNKEVAKLLDQGGFKKSPKSNLPGRDIYTAEAAPIRQESTTQKESAVLDSKGNKTFQSVKTQWKVSGTHTLVIDRESPRFEYYKPGKKPGSGGSVGGYDEKDLAKLIKKISG